MDAWKIALGVAFVCMANLASGVPTHDQEDCSMCVGKLQLFVEYLQTDLLSTDQSTPSLCDNVPAEFRSVCHDLTASMGEDVSLDPNDDSLASLCRMMGQCRPARQAENQGNPLVFDAEIEPNLMELGTNVQGLPCTLCDNILKIIQTFLKDKSHQDMLLKLLTGACAFLPIMKTQCVMYVNMFGRTAISMAAQYINPQLCKTFHICKNKLASTKESCELCQFSVGIIRDGLNDPAIETRLTVAVEQLCENLGNDRAVCQDLSQNAVEILPQIIRSLREKTDLSALCQESGICRKTGYSTEDSSESDEDMFQ